MFTFDLQFFINFFGYAALIAAVSSYLFKDELKFKLLQLLCTFLFFIHFLLDDAVAGYISLGIGVVSLSASIYFKNKKINYGFFAIYIGLFIYGVLQFNEQPWHEMLPYVSNIFWAIGMLLVTGNRTNYLLIGVVSCWIVYAIQISSLPNFLTQIFVLSFLLYRTFKLYQLEKKQKNNLDTITC
jgi:hypothetical protein